MAAERFSDHCSLMMHPERTTRPADCPEDASYIISSEAGGQFKLPANAPFPLVFDGGEGDDKVTVVGEGDKGVLVLGGKGNDSLMVRDSAPGEVGNGAAVGELPGHITLVETENGLEVQPKGNAEAAGSLVVREGPGWAIAEMPIEALLFLGAILVVFATVGALGWRALSNSASKRAKL